MEAIVKAERSKAAAATATAGAHRRPLAPSEKNNAAPAGRRTESPSRLKPVSVSPAAPAPPAPAAPAARRCSSPSPGRASADGGSATCTRARSAAAPSPAPSSRLKPSAAARSASAVPPRGAAADGHSSTPPRARKAKDSDGPSASARSSCSSPLLRPEAEHGLVSPASKVDRLVRGLPSEPVARLRPGAVAERKTSPRPRRGSTNNTGDRSQHENARPPESPAANSVALADKHWWPGMMTGRGLGRGSAGLSSTTAASAGKASRSDASSSSDASAGRSPPRRTRPCEGAAATGKSVRRRPSNETAPKIVHRRRKDKAADSSSDASSQTSESSRPTWRPTKAVSLPVPVLHRSSSPRPPGGLPAASSTTSRSCQTPSRMRPSAAPCQSKCASPAARTVVEQPAFFYILDARKGKKNACQIESIHQLRLLSSRYLQWRFVNAHSEETLSHRNSVESVLYNVWRSISTLRDAITITRTSVLHQQQQVKLYGILTEQIGYIEQWPVLEEECNDTLVEATQALKASTLRLPVTSGAQADGIAVRNAISSAVDVMQALSSSIYCVQSKVEDRTSLVSELSATAREEKVALDQCRELLATAAKLQVQETSLRTLLMQLRQRSAG